MSQKYVRALFLFGFIMGVLYGCGGGGGGSDVTINTTAAANPAVPVTLVNPESQACVACHSAAPAGGTTAQSPSALYALSLHNTENAATCVDCHQTTPGHSAASSPGTKTAQAIYNLNNPDLLMVSNGNVVAGSQCLNCHTKDKLGLPHFNKDVSNTITGFSGTQPAQYVDGTYDRAGVPKCTGCHTSHDANRYTMPIFKAYAESGHGNVRGQGWVYYRWKSTGQPGAGGVADPNGNRAACQRCHTTSGFLSQILNITATGTTRLARGQLQFDTSGNSTRDNTKQVLRCDGCHEYKNFRYTVRDASGSLTALYTDVSTYVYKDQYGNAGNAAREAEIIDASGTIRYPNIGKSNLCINCHAGRENGYSIKRSTANFANVSFINSHYLGAAEILYRTGGYRYDDVSTNLTYDNRYSFRHRFAGLDTPNLKYDASGNTESRNYTATTGDGGPCVSCHMYPIRHTFKPVKKDESTGKITAVTSGICVACHTTGMGSAELEEEAENFNTTLDVFQVQLAEKGFHFYNAHPYFYTSPYDPNYKETGSCSKNLAVRNWNTGGTTNFTWSGTSCTPAIGTAGTAGTGKHNMGAAFNFNLLKHEPGAYTHNRRYTKRLIWDSIDWLDDNVMNGSTIAAIDALAAAGKITATQQTKAKTYLGSTRP
ncbi:MAG: hypothetical protein N2745_09190 [Syntrophorhabdaceae bacterium]|nr:hypothetical protein [Syntrophorhabdaceae bacterium]